MSLWSSTVPVSSLLITILGEEYCLSLLSFSCPFFTFENIAYIISGKPSHCLQSKSLLQSKRCCFGLGAGINSCHMPETDILLMSVLFFLKSAGCSVKSEAAVAWLWLHCGHEGPLVASSRPSPEHRLALLPHPLVTSLLSILNGGIGGSMHTRCFNWLLLDWFSVWRTFRMTLVHLCQSLNTYGSHSGPVVLVSKHFFQDPGFGEGFLGDVGRFQCVWPSEEIFLLYKEVAQLSSAQLRWAVVCPAEKQETFYLADIWTKHLTPIHWVFLVLGRDLQRAAQIRFILSFFPPFKKDSLACQITWYYE